MTDEDLKTSSDQPCPPTEPSSNEGEMTTEPSHHQKSSDAKESAASGVTATSNFEFAMPKPRAVKVSQDAKDAPLQPPPPLASVPEGEKASLDIEVGKKEKAVNSPQATGKEVENSAHYYPPDWAEPCPSDSGYRLEVIKNGVPLPEDTVNLSDEADSANHCILGRQPKMAVGDGGISATFLHPSISRVHALLQFGVAPSTNQKQGSETAGWFIRDMKSSHGTFVNKHRLPPYRYIRLHVGHVIRLGSSTRLLILQGPAEDVQAQTSESWSELVKAHEKQKADELNSKLKQQLCKNGEHAENEDADSGGSEMSNSQRTDLEPCNWGMGEDAKEGDSLEMLLSAGASCLSHESMYVDDPKKVLKAFFDRQGIEPHPQYEFVEGRFGQQVCRLELELDTGTVYAEQPVSGKKKDVIIACALEACRILDRLGEFDRNTESAVAVRQARQKEYWQNNDYYSSDEDPFLDRTGQLELRRKKRMRKFGAEEDPSVADQTDAKNTVPEGSLNMLSRLEELGKEIIAIEDEYNAAEKAVAAVGENASEMDELEAYMEAIKRGAPGREARQALKRRIFELRQEESRILRCMGIRQCFKGEFSSSASSAAAMAVRSAMEKSKAEGNSEHKECDLEGIKTKEEVRNGTKLNSLKRLLRTSTKAPSKSKTNFKFATDFVPENDEEKEQEQEIEKESKVEAPEPFEADEVQVETMTSEDPKAPDTEKMTGESRTSQLCGTTQVDASLPTQKESGPPKSPSSVSVKKTPFQEPSVLPPPHLSPSRIQAEVGEPSSKKRRRTKPHKLPKAIESRFPDAESYDISNPNYALWVPPEDQTGDGMTELNKKYGY